MSIQIIIDTINRNKNLKYLLYLILFFIVIIFAFLMAFKFIYPIEDKMRSSTDEYVKEYGVKYIELESVNQDFVDSILMTEDRRFYSHNGIDSIGVLRAIKTNVVAGELKEGASTITQQLIKNIILSHERTFERKAKEAVLALATESYMDKDYILETYINIIYFGNGAYGIENASQLYFGKSSSDLTISESTFLAGLPNGPSLYDPYTNMELAKQRQKEILNNLVDTGYITEEESEEIYQKQLNIKEKQ